jgi:hypothetical protein
MYRLALLVDPVVEFRIIIVCHGNGSGSGKVMPVNAIQEPDDRVGGLSGQQGLYPFHGQPGFGAAVGSKSKGVAQFADALQSRAESTLNIFLTNNSNLKDFSELHAITSVIYRATEKSDHFPSIARAPTIIRPFKKTGAKNGPACADGPGVACGIRI